MDHAEFLVQVNQTAITSISAFAAYVGDCQNVQRSGVFIRLIGMEQEAGYLQEIAAMDELLNRQKAQQGTGYLRVHSLNTAVNTAQISRYEAMLAEGSFPVRFENEIWSAAIDRAFSDADSKFAAAVQNASESMRHNFKIKLLSRIEYYVPKLFLKTKELGHFPKLVLCAPIKQQEYLFLWFLVQLGCDVLYLNPAEDLSPQFGALLKLSALHQAKVKKAMQIPEQIPVQANPVAQRAPVQPQPSSAGGAIRMDREKFRRPERDKAKVPSPASAAPPASTAPPPRSAPARRPPQQAVAPVPAPDHRTERSYEELASFAASVVMIRVFDGQNECLKTGSGVFISSGGYILTNFHVVRGGAYFGVRLEEQENEFFTSELIKYHDINDLALLRVDTTCRPIPVYRGSEALRRGQRVVAIGSPLGLFNSVSDGIISGFRKVKEVSMVQFTAPTSPGSSGGALLDMYGNLIGILTAGFDGQNLNIAVDYQTIVSFVRGFA